MTVQNTASFIDYTGDDVTTSFPFTFRADDVSWLTVDFTDDFDTFLLNLDQENNPGGSAEYLVAPPSPGMGGPDPSFRIERLTPLDQELSYTRYDPFDSKSTEDSIDKLTMQIQDGVTYVDAGDLLLQTQIDDNTLLITTGVSPGHQHVIADITDFGNYTDGTLDEDITGFWEFINVSGMAVWDAGKNGGAQFRTSLGGFEISPLGVNDRIWVNGRFEITRAGVVADSTSFIHDGINVVWDGQNAAAIELTGFTDRIIQGAEVYAYLSDIVAGGTPGGADTEVQFNNGGVFDGDPLFTWDGANVAATTFNSVPLTAAGLITDFLNATGTYSVPGGGGGTPGGADTQIQYNDAGAFAGDAALVWDDVNKRITIDKTGGTGAGLIITAIPSNTPAIQTGILGSSGSNIPLKMFDSSGSQFFQWFFDTSLSSGNHKLELQSSSGGTVPFIEFDNSGEMTFGGAQNQGSMQFTGLFSTIKAIMLDNGQGGLYFEEQASAGATNTGDGQFWVRNTLNGEPMFTDELGTDSVLNEAASFTPPLILLDDEKIIFGTGPDWNLDFDSTSGALEFRPTVVSTPIAIQSGGILQFYGAVASIDPGEIYSTGTLGFSNLTFDSEAFDFLSGAIDVHDLRFGRPKIDCYALQHQVENSVANAVTYDHLFGTGSDTYLTTLTENITSVTLANPAASGAFFFEIEIIQDNPARTITWPGTVTWDGGTAPDLTTVDGHYYVVLRSRDAGTSYLGVWSGPFS